MRIILDLETKEIDLLGNVSEHDVHKALLSYRPAEWELFKEEEVGNVNSTPPNYIPKFQSPPKGFEVKTVMEQFFGFPIKSLDQFMLNEQIVPVNHVKLDKKGMIKLNKDGEPRIKKRYKHLYK